ncbi:MAG: deoxynucleoside kinase [Saprospiraceae bacterium]|nr:deoxynucleoside kinase [Saprospiraceae bacterium]
MKKQIPYNYICIEGNIGAGKTTLTSMLAADLKCRLILEEFAENPFLEFFYKDPQRYALPTELFFLAERHKQLQATILHDDLFAEFTLADYSLVKSLLFASHNLDKTEFNLFQRIYQQMNHSTPKPDLILYLHRPVEKVKKHIIDRARSYEMKIEDQYLEKVQNSYFDFFKSQTVLPVLVLDAEHIDFIDNKLHFEEIKKSLRQKYQPGLHHLRILF